MMVLNSYRYSNDYTYDGELTGVYTSGVNFGIPGSVDPVTIYTKFRHDSGVTNLPIVVIGHGITGNILSVPDAIFTRLASYGFFVVGVTVGDLSGYKDLSGRELFNYIDAVEYYRTNYAAVVNPNKIAFVGWSGSGGNALGLYCKFPDFFNAHIAYFPMSDYGYTATGWHQTNPDVETGQTYQVTIENAMGGTPAEKPNVYRSRNTREAITNFGLLTPLRIFHDEDDAFVDVVHSRAIDTAIGVNSKFIYNETNSLSPDRWTHEFPDTGSSLIASESLWNDLPFSSNPVIVPTAGTIKVIGYIVTKRFEIYLRDDEVINLGRNRTATVTYDTVSMEYLVTPIFETGASYVVVVIKQDNQEVIRKITQETLITFDPLVIQDVNITNALVAGYSFDGNALDSVGTNNGTEVNTTYADNAAEFNVNKYITLPDADIFSFTDGVNDRAGSFSFWVNLTSLSSGQFWFGGKRDTTGLPDSEYQFLYISNTIRFDIYHSGTSTPWLQVSCPVLANDLQNKWLKITFVYDGNANDTTGMAILINGTLQVCTQIKAGAADYVGCNNTNSVVTLGALPWIKSNSANAMIGKMKNLTWYDIALTEAQDLEVYNIELNNGVIF